MKIKNYFQYNKKGREYISLKDYGKAFKFTETPKYAVDNWSEDMISIVTPENDEAWTDWKDLSGSKLEFWKNRWNKDQKTLPDYKYQQIMRSKNKI